MLLHVTPDGSALARTWASSYRRATEELFAPLDDEELAALAELLRKLGAGPAAG